MIPVDLGPAYLALAVFPLVALLCAVPYVALQYRRRGTVGAGHLVLAAAFGLYLVGLAFYVVLPLHEVTPDFCARYGVDAHFDPLRILQEARVERATGGWRAVLGDSEIQVAVLNVFLFIPLGMFARHLLRRGIAATVVLGLGVSLAIELTQLTGNWGIYPCAYRFFESFDLITNMTGAAIGAVCAPLLRLVPAQRTLADPGERQLVTPSRRLLAAACNAALILIAGLCVAALAGAVLELTRGELFEADSARARAFRATTLVWLPGVLVTLAAPLAARGRTPGEWAVLIRARGREGEPPRAAAIVARFALGAGPLLALAGLGVAGAGGAWPAFAALASVQALLLARPGLRSDPVALRSGVRLDDSR